MPQQTIRLLTPVPAQLSSQLSSRIHFVSEAITGFRLEHDADEIVAVTVDVAAVDGADLARRLNEMIADDVLPQRLSQPRVVWRSGQPDRLPRDVFAELVDRGIATPVGEGQVALGTPMLELIDYLDGRLRALIASAGGVERRYPTLIPTAALHRCGYFAAFPQHVMFATRLRTDLDTYRSFAAGMNGEAGPGPSTLRHCANLDYCLPPTMCFHTFHELSGRSLVRPETAITSRGRSNRHESRYHRSLERLWDFTIREAVFLGGREWVLGRRDALQRAAYDLVTELGLTGRCEVGNDPFFAAPDTVERIWSQRLLEVKYELRIAVAPDHTVAAGSFNFHDRFFAESFGITLPTGETAHTACAGFGLERLAYAFACQHGIEPAEWPEPVREYLVTRSLRP
ncbi:hypothetical protein [Plantactinospora sp. DSM 117369]